MSQKKIQMSESFGLAILLAIVGGFLDAYTYICRDHVFANAQTGNIVQVGITLANGNWLGTLRYIIPILSFFVGVLIVMYVRDHNRTPLHWRQLILVAESIIFIIVAFLPIDKNFNMLANVLVSFSCALQAETFSKVLGKPFSSVMCTGNLKSGTEHLYHALKERDFSRLYKVKDYFLVILFFIIGAFLGTILTARMQEKSILCTLVVMIGAVGLMFREN